MYDACVCAYDCARDPIWYERGPSVYLYVLGRVLDFVDPSGLRSELGGDISNWPNWGDPPNVRHPLTPLGLAGSIISPTITPNMQHIIALTNALRRLYRQIR
jgi:hypothetical protein